MTREEERLIRMEAVAIALALDRPYAAGVIREAIQALKSALGSLSTSQTTAASSEPQIADHERMYGATSAVYEPLFSTEWELDDYRRMKYGLPPLGPLAKRA